VIFDSANNACSYIGLIKEGYQNVKSINDSYRITPTMKYYTSMIDLLSCFKYIDAIKYFIIACK